jgi:DNA-binding transcriptional LysR family regulator
MAFIASPRHPLANGRRVSLNDVAGANLLARERGSGTRSTLERLFKDAELSLRIGSELSSNEAIKQMCAAGLGVAFVSLHTCALELDAGLLQLLPLAHNPIERQWFVMHLAGRRLPHAATAFERYLVAHGQQHILRQAAGRPTCPKRNKPRQ